MNLPHNQTPIIGLSGQMGSGKTSVTDELSRIAREKYGYQFVNTIKFAAPLYEMHEYLLNKMEGFTGQKRVDKDGELLQYLGTEFGRVKFGQDVWVKICRNKADNLSQYNTKSLIFLDDMRFENEFNAFPDAFRVRLDCPENIRKQRAHSWRKNTKHPSETGLDKYAGYEDRMWAKALQKIGLMKKPKSKFDMHFNTDGTQKSPTQIAEIILEILETGCKFEKHGN